MTFDAWTLTVLGLVLLVLTRPAVASLLQRSGARSVRRKYNPERAGGGAAMLVLAGYLVSGPSQTVGWGFWNLLSYAIHDSFVRSLPIVWVPALCWVILVILGLGWLYAGTRGYRGPRNSLTLVWALNEVILCTVLLLLRAYVPDDWQVASFINFGLEGVYLSFLIGAVLRFFLVLFNPGGPTDTLDQRLGGTGGTWISRLRRY